MPHATRMDQALCFAVAICCAVGCDDAPTTAVVENAYPAPAEAGPAEPVTVFQVWWVATLFPTPVAPGASSEIERTIPGSDFAYALLAPGWLPDAGTRPSRLIAVKSVAALSATAHELLTISLSDARFSGNCAAGSTLSEEDARLVVERIFPGDFAGLTYDPATCTTAAVPDGGGD
jgi:hypothetical protein